MVIKDAVRHSESSRVIRKRVRIERVLHVEAVGGVLRLTV